jgi:hypothetical protein
LIEALAGPGDDAAMMLRFILILMFPMFLRAQSVESVSVYELSDLIGSQVYFASHFKPEALRDPKKVDDEDRAALLGAIGKSGIAIPRLKVPYVRDDTVVQAGLIRLMKIRQKDGTSMEIGQNEYKDGKDDLLVFRAEDTITCLLLAEGVTQIYTIHLNVTFPGGEKLVTMHTTRNRPLGVSTMTVSGKAKRVE